MVDSCPAHDANTSVEATLCMASAVCFQFWGHIPDKSVWNTGARQLFWGDVHSTTTHFQPLFLFLAYSVVFGQQRERLDSLPTQSQAAVISVVSCFLPYYDDPEVTASFL